MDKEEVVSDAELLPYENLDSLEFMEHFKAEAEKIVFPFESLPVPMNDDLRQHITDLQ